jgi:hypothetical protein
MFGISSEFLARFLELKRISQASISETWETTSPVRANSKRLPHRRWLLFLFLHRPLGVGQDFVGY